VFVVLHSGRVGRFNPYALLLALTTSMTLLAVARVIVYVVATQLMPDRALYREAMHREMEVSARGGGMESMVKHKGHRHSSGGLTQGQSSYWSALSLASAAKEGLEEPLLVVAGGGGAGAHSHAQKPAAEGGDSAAANLQNGGGGADENEDATAR
jgi:hypothetical protein